MYELLIPALPAGRLAVVSFTGEEAISRPFELRIVATAVGVDVGALERDVLGQPGAFAMRGEDESARTIHGVFRRVEAEDVSGAAEEQHHFRLWLVPRFWVLSRNRNTRIFQDRTVQQIVDQVLRESGVRARFELVRTYAPRNYCVQYQESDRRFVERLLDEEGISYFFEHPEEDEGEEVMVFSDDLSVARPVAGDPHFHFRDSAGMAENDGDIRRFRLGHRVRARTSLLREFDWTRPSLDLTAGAEVREDGTTAALEGLAGMGRGALDALRVGIPSVPGTPPMPSVPSIPGMPSVPGIPDLPGTVSGLPLPGAPDRSDSPGLRMYDHHGEFEGAGVDVPVARRHLEQHRRRAVVAEGESRSRRLQPGRWFELGGAAIPAHDGRYLVIAVEHEGHQPEAIRAISGAPKEVYRNRLWTVPSGTPYRPKRPRRRIQQVIETATVVGPPGQEIHTDAHGRIKVQFHWDRQGRRNEHSSCWIRVMQAWAGTGWGFQFIPRVGMEVIVSFVGGDADRPMVLGSAYNAEHPPPFPLPRDKTRSGIRTQSSRGGGGHNELSFEDRKHREQIYVFAQRDLDVTVSHDHTTTVANHQTTRVTGNQTTQVSGLQFNVVGGNRIDSVAGNNTVTTAGSHGLTVDGSLNEHVRLGRTSRVAGDESKAVGGNESVHVRHNLDVRIAGNQTMIVGDPKNDEPEMSGMTTSVWGRHVVSASKKIVLGSREAVELRCGDSVISITEEGISLRAKKIRLQADEELSLVGAGAAATLADDVEVTGEDIKLYSSGATLLLSGDATVKAGSIKLKSGSGSSEDPPSESGDEETVPVKLVLSDAEGEPYANKPYMLLVGDLSLEGTTAADGKIDKRVPKSATLGELVLWTGGRRGLGEVRWQVRLSHEDLPPPTTVRGVSVRLANMGYYEGPPTDEITGLLGEAIRCFQADEGLTPTGRVDEDTAGKLTDRHGH